MPRILSQMNFPVEYPATLSDNFAVLQVYVKHQFIVLSNELLAIENSGLESKFKKITKGDFILLFGNIFLYIKYQGTFASDSSKKTLLYILRIFTCRKKDNVQRQNTPLYSYHIDRNSSKISLKKFILTSKSKKCLFSVGIVLQFFKYFPVLTALSIKWYKTLDIIIVLEIYQK